MRCEPSRPPPAAGSPSKAEFLPQTPALLHWSPTHACNASRSSRPLGRQRQVTHSTRQTGAGSGPARPRSAPGRGIRPRRGREGRRRSASLQSPAPNPKEVDHVDGARGQRSRPRTVLQTRFPRGGSSGPRLLPLVPGLTGSWAHPRTPQLAQKPPPGPARRGPPCSRRGESVRAQARPPRGRAGPSPPPPPTSRGSPPPAHLLPRPPRALTSGSSRPRPLG